jgi:hypothetical protein
MFKASQTIALSFPSLLLAAIASTSSVSANQINPTVEKISNSSNQLVNITNTNVDGNRKLIDEVTNVSELGLTTPLPISAQQELSSTPVPFEQLSNSQVGLSSQSSDLAQVTSVSQLTDVRPTDWAFTALQSLVERYGVIAGYPDRTYRGKQALTRYEFAAGLNTALDKINEVISAGLADKVSKEDLATLQKLQEEFASELATLRGRVDSLDAKTAKLEAQQFSTTTKLSGTANFLLAGLSTNSVRTGSTNPRNTNLVFAYSVNLRLNTSFTGKDLLTINLGTNNAPGIAAITGTNVANFALDGSTATTAPNTFSLGQLFYRFPIGDKATVWLSARSLQPFDYFPLISPLREGTSVPNTSYGLFNPVIFRPGFTNTGVGAAYRFSDAIQLHAGYFASDVQASNPAAGSRRPGTPASTPDPATGNGLFGGSQTIAAQLTVTPSDTFKFSLNYIRKYWTGTNGIDRAGETNFSGPTGTNLAVRPFGDVATIADTFGGQFDWRIFPKVGFGGWFSTTAATNLTPGPAKANILNAALSLGFYDLFKEGNHGGILVGISPYVNSSDGARDTLTPWHLETFYTHRFNRNISITPGVFVILNPDAGTPEPIYGLSLRTTFVF